MACARCRHFQARGEQLGAQQDIMEWARDLTGVCTFSPTWADVTGLHYCGQFSPDHPAMIGELWASAVRRSSTAKRT
jgi:hypothetical protein